MGDNRNYIYDSDRLGERLEYRQIVNWVEKGSKVIDLGCGNGSLLVKLREEKAVKGFGIELSDSGVEIARKHGLDVIKSRIDEKLVQVKDGEYDYSICNVTLQMVLYPETLLSEMKRISKRQIISFPNFAFITQRFELMFLGRMPRRLLYHYNWFDTGHIHQLSISDFRQTARKMGFSIVDSAYLLGKYRTLNVMPNLLATAGIFLLE
jgi:methionine biosynthesis protein MetW